MSTNAPAPAARGHGKRYRASADRVERGRRYSIEEACRLAAVPTASRFDETVDVAVRLGVDPKHADQMVRGAVSLPHGTGKKVRVAVFARGDKEKEAQEAGADVVGGEELAARIQKDGWLEFDACVATPDLMGLVGRLGKVLGPRGLMPNPKVGTVTMDVARVVRELKAGRVEFRTEKAGVVHAPIGKVSFGAGKLRENLLALLELIVKLKPSSAKGAYLRSVTLSSTMGPGIAIDPLEVAALGTAGH